MGVEDTLVDAVLSTARIHGQAVSSFSGRNMDSELWPWDSFLYALNVFILIKGTIGIPR